jgi:hypothetical protein
MKIEIYADTFKATGVNKYGRKVGTVMTNCHAEPLVAVLHEDFDNMIAVAGFVGRYVTSNKPWPAHVKLRNGRVDSYFGRDDRSGRYTKGRGISFEPATHAKLTNEDYWKAAL